MMCQCSTKHVPAPMTLSPVDTPSRGMVWLCPTASDNLQCLLTEYSKAAGVPVGSVTKHYGKLIRDLAKEIWKG